MIIHEPRAVRRRVRTAAAATPPRRPAVVRAGPRAGRIPAAPTPCALGLCTRRSAGGAHEPRPGGGLELATPGRGGGGLVHGSRSWRGSRSSSSRVVLALLLAALLHRPVVRLRRFLPRAAAGLLVLLGALAVDDPSSAGSWPSGYRPRRRRCSARPARSSASSGAGSAPCPGSAAAPATSSTRVNAWVQAHGSVVLTGAFTAGHVTDGGGHGRAADRVPHPVPAHRRRPHLELAAPSAPRRAQPGVNGAGHRAWHVLSGWITGTAIISLIHAVVIGTAMELLGTPLVLVLTVLGVHRQLHPDHRHLPRRRMHGAHHAGDGRSRSPG